MSRALDRPTRMLIPTFLVGLLALAAPASTAEDALVARWESGITADAGTTAPSGELRDALAVTVIERNVLATQRDALAQQRWLILVYAAITSLIAAWFIRAYLRKHTAVRIAQVDSVTTKQSKPANAANATITIRNADTQQPEIIGRVTTRKLFRYRTQPFTPAPAVARPTPQVAKDQHSTVVMRPLPARPVVRIATPVVPASETTSVMRRRPEVRDYTPTEAIPIANQIGHKSSILLPVQMNDADETTNVRIARRDGQVLARQGLSLLEVMISLAILATVLASVSGGIFALSTARRGANEDVIVSGLMHMWAERMMGADWEWLGRDRTDDATLQGAWSWQRPESKGPLLPGDHPPMLEGATDPLNSATVQILGDTKSGVDGLRLHLEYYRPMALELCFTPVDGAAAATTWADTRNAYRLTPPIDLRQHADAVVVRLVVAWTSQHGGARQREIVFARTR